MTPFSTPPGRIPPGGVFYTVLIEPPVAFVIYYCRNVRCTMSNRLKIEWNVPNVLTIIRFMLIPVFCVLMRQDNMKWSLIVFLLASFTDLMDGYIARKNNAITQFGKLMDPLADKLMVLSLMIGMLLKGIIPAAAFIILIVKEALMVLGGVLLFTRRDTVVYSKPIGKVAQFITVVALVLCFFHKQFFEMGYPIHLWTLWLGVGLAIASLFFYAHTNVRSLFKKTKTD